MTAEGPRRSPPPSPIGPDPGPGTIARVVADDLCIGCGLCQSATGGRVRMTPTAHGSLRPTPVDGFAPQEEAAILSACPGVVAEARPSGASNDGDEDGERPAVDPIWGSHRWIGLAWAGDPAIRFRAATGGVLTALAMTALTSGRVTAVLQVAADPDRPLANRWILSTTAADVAAASGSRYAPTAPLAGLGPALDRGRPFAVVAKPCDLGAVHRWASVDPRVDRLCTVRLTMVCGGQSRQTKTSDLLDRLGIEPDEVTAIRYRGDGNPGPTRVETRSGRVEEVGYLEMWADEATWDVETRCKLCPDALGEAADVAAADAWPGGAPIGEDEGFNSIVVRTALGRELVAEAVATGALVLGRRLGPRDLDDHQPHQVAKKRALAARHRALADLGTRPSQTRGLRVAALGRGLGADRFAAERSGTAERIRAARARVAGRSSPPPQDRATGSGQG